MNLGSLIFINPQISIPFAEIEFSFVRSSGPGGQNVNKVNSKSVLRWNVFQTQCVPLEVKQKLLHKLGPRLTRLGELVITNDTYRDQRLNRRACLDKLCKIIFEATKVPVIRKKTKPTRSSLRQARKEKTLHSQKKNSRKPSRDLD